MLEGIQNNSGFNNTKKKIWLHTWILTGIIFLLCLIISLIIYQVGWAVAVSRSLAGTSALLIGSSFALSGFCYYWDFLDSKISYRKYLGLAGFWTALAYSVSLLIVEPERYFFGFAKNFFTPDIILGLAAMIILTFMALISTDKMMIMMGPQNWRRALRWGYYAWMLLILRAWFIEKGLWRNWFIFQDGPVPPRLVLSLLALGIILFRISIEISKNLKKILNINQKEI